MNSIVVEADDGLCGARGGCSRRALVRGLHTMDPRVFLERAAAIRVDQYPSIRMSHSHCPMAKVP